MTSGIFPYYRYASFDGGFLVYVSVYGAFVHGSHLFGAVCCSGALENADFLGDDIPGFFRIQRSLARQWIHVWRQFTIFWYFTYFLRTCSRVVLSPVIPAIADEEAAALVVVNGDMAGFAGYVAPRAVLWHVQGGFRISRCVPFALRQAQAFRHHGGYGPEGQFLRSHTCGVHRCSSWTLFSCPFWRETVVAARRRRVEVTLAIRAGKGWRGRRESDSQVTCHPNLVHLLTCIDRAVRQVPRPHQYHQHHQHHPP